MPSGQEDSLSGWMRKVDVSYAWFLGNIGRMKARKPVKKDEIDAAKLLVSRHASLSALIKKWGRLECRFNCGGLCCQFPDEHATILLSSNIIPEVRTHMASAGLPFEDYVSERRLDELPKGLFRAAQDEDYTFEKDGVKMVYEARTVNDPLRFQYRLCRFLNDEGLCTLYLAGMRPRCCLPFICTPGLTVLIAMQWGYVTNDQVAYLDTAGLCALSENLLEVFESLQPIEEKYQDSLIDLGEAYVGGSEMAKKVEEFMNAEKEYLKKRDALFKSKFNPGLLEKMKRRPA